MLSDVSICLIFNVLFLQVKTAIKDLEDSKETRMPQYTELVVQRNEVKAAEEKAAAGTWRAFQLERLGRVLAFAACPYPASCRAHLV